MGPWPFWSCSLLAFALMDLFPPKLQGRAELSSLRTNDRFRIVVSPVMKESKVPIQGNDGAKVFSPLITETDGSLTPRSGTENQAGIQTLSDCDDRGEKCLKSPGEDQVPKNIDSDRRDRVRRSQGMPENLNGETRGETMARKTIGEAIQAVSNARADYWRSGDDARGSNPRQSEPHLDTSTFALAGDSAHNQAMVHWSGHNSSVSSSLTIRTEESHSPRCCCCDFCAVILVRKSSTFSQVWKNQSHFYAHLFPSA